MTSDQLTFYFKALEESYNNGQDSLVRSCLINCLDAQYVVNCPESAWQVISAYRRFFKEQKHSISDTFDSLYGDSAMRFTMLNFLMKQLIEQRSKRTAGLFLNFIRTCQLKDIHRHHPIFEMVLPLSHPIGPHQLYEWLQSEMLPEDRLLLIAMLIFAMHPPEYLESGKKSWGLFKKRRSLFSNEVQGILCDFKLTPLLDSPENEGILNHLRSFGFPEPALQQLEKEASKAMLKARIY